MLISCFPALLCCGRCLGHAQRQAGSCAGSEPRSGAEPVSVLEGFAALEPLLFRMRWRSRSRICCQLQGWHRWIFLSGLFLGRSGARWTASVEIAP